ncbi:DNA alkylation repair protein [Flavobacterium sp. NKUCC04_CG]|uniref:DNA alkylation repair protein n=1 Tax=Flavobacterium sp. NKUCC04_CG TaxID=2842121 RepID=UPI001C5BE8AF|nr:DNA alkylation repair protein [Flavobacterium sp. NKUCC04_CG]MBW3517596.1 DNA alkylation repair protein [Flavobacterium sp. NKUCC04_CG]
MKHLEILNRKGAIKAELIPEAVVSLLNQGLIESVNLVEWSAVNHRELVRSTFPQLGLEAIIPDIIAVIDGLAKPSTMKSVAAIGEFLYQHAFENQILDQLYTALCAHSSDSIRCYACYIIALQKDLSIQHRLEEARFLIADPHFGVREIIWMALRPELVKQLDEVLLYLLGWTGDSDERIRRFITEVTRPKGVWTSTIVALKNHPEQALPILEVLRADPSLYVQNSVANWLNDASKSQPEFVRNLCARWSQESHVPATQYIVKRALRTLDK